MRLSWIVPLRLCETAHGNDHAHLNDTLFFPSIVNPTRGKLIDPTRPIDRRNEKGEIVGADSKAILTARGKPITNLYHDRVIAQGEREDNPAADRYPVLSKNDQIAACMPKATDTNPRRLWEKAKAYWEGMEAQGIIRIKRERNGWRIFPSQEHLAAHRGVRASAQNKRVIGVTLIGDRCYGNL